MTRLKGVDEELPPAPRFRQVHVHVPGILLGLLIGWLAFPPTVHSQRADTTTVFFEHSMPDTPEYRWMKDTVRKELAARFPGRAIRFNSLSRSSSGVALETSIPREYRIVTYYFRKYDGHWEMLPDTRLRQTNDSGKPRPTETTGWMVDTVRAMVAHMKPAPTIGTPRFTGDTAWVGASVSGTHGDAFWVRTITHRFERTDGTWRLSPRFEISIAHGGREPKAPPPNTASQGAVDTAAIRKLASENGIDTANAQLKVRGDTAWIWSRRDSGYSIGMELRRQNGKWVTQSVTNTTSAAPAALPGRRPQRDTTRKP